MVLSNILLGCLSFFSILFTQSCPQIDVNYTVDAVEEKYRVTLTVDGGHAPYRYMFYDSNGRHVTEGYEYLADYVDVSQGEYLAVVYDENGCSGKVKINID